MIENFPKINVKNIKSKKKVGDKEKTFFDKKKVIFLSFFTIRSSSQFKKLKNLQRKKKEKKKKIQMLEKNWLMRSKIYWLK